MSNDVGKILGLDPGPEQFRDAIKACKGEFNRLSDNEKLHEKAMLLSFVMAALTLYVLAAYNLGNRKITIDEVNIAGSITFLTGLVGTIYNRRKNIKIEKEQNKVSQEMEGFERQLADLEADGLS